MSLLLGLIPWLIFRVVESSTSFPTAALAGLLAAVVLAAARRDLGVLNAGMAALFAAFVAASFVVDQDWLVTYAPVLADAGLAAVMAGSVLVGRPFTEAFARRRTPAHYWDTPRFRQVNIVISGAWTVAMGLLAAAALAEIRLGGGLLFGLVVPALLILGAVGFTRRYPNSLDRRPARQSTS